MGRSTRQDRVASLRSACRSFGRDERGAVFVYVALILVVLVGVASLAVDLGQLHTAKRRQQAASDIAAMAAASDLTRRSAAATANLIANGFNGDDIVSVTLGSYEPNATVPSETRFVPGPTGEAVSVEVRTSLPTILAGVVTGMAGGSGINSFPVSTTSVAAADRRAAFAIGSRLVRVNAGVINSVLGALLGTSLSLDAADYEALAAVNLDLFTFSEQLSSQLSLGAGTYNEVINSDVRLGDAFRAAHAAAVAAGAGSRAIAALDTIARGTLTSARVLDLNQLAAFGYSGNRSLGHRPPLAATVTAFDLITAFAQIANGNRQVDTSIVATLPGIASATLKVIVGERPVGSSMVAVGKEGATVHTAQVRLQLNLNLVGDGVATFVQLPIYVDVARGSARLSALTCEPWEPTTSRITLMVRPGVVDARIGTISSSQFAATGTTPTHTPATLVQIPLGASVSGHSDVTWSSTAETAQQFTYGDVVARTKKTTSTTTSPSMLVNNLVSNLSLSLAGIDLSIPGLVVATRQIITNHRPVIDELLLSTLTALGANVGQVDTWVSGVRCGTSVLVN